MIRSNKVHFRIYGWLAVFAVAITLYSQWYLLTTQYSTPEDTRGSIIWMTHLRDHEAFNGDLYLKYLNWKIPLGLKEFYFLTGLFVDPFIVVKILPFFLCLILVLYAYKLGYFLRDTQVGLLIAFFAGLLAWYHENSLCHSGVWFSEGGAGDFHPILAIIFIYYFVKKDYCKTALTMVGQCLFYPPLFLVSVLTYMFSGVTYFTDASQLYIDKKKWFWFVCALTIGFALIVPKYLVAPPYVGETISFQQMEHMDEFHVHGRTPMFYQNLFEQIANFRSGIELNKAKVALLLILLVLIGILRKRTARLPLELWCFLLAGFMMYFLAYLFLFKFFSPSRYVRYVLPIFLITTVALNIDTLIRHSKYKNKIIVYGFVMVIIFIVAVPYLQNYYDLKEKWFNEYVDKKLYVFLASLPKDVLLAGHPDVMDDVVLFSRRRSLIIQELSLPYHTGLYSNVCQWTKDFFSAYYATSLIDIYKFCAQYKIDYVVMYKKHFSNDYITAGNYYLEPFNKYIENILASEKSKNFALVHMPEEKIVFDDDKYRVLRCH